MVDAMDLGSIVYNIHKSSSLFSCKMYLTILFAHFFTLTAWLVAAVNRYLLAWLSLSWLWNWERTAELLANVRVFYPTLVWCYARAITPLVFKGKVV